MQLKITKSTVETVKETAKRTSRRHYIFDTELQGFGLSVTPKGAASYFIEYRMPDKRRLSIGAHGRLTPAEARRQAKVLLGEVAKGIDVARQPRGNKTFAAAFEAFMKNNGRGNRSWDSKRRYVEYDVLPVWANKPITAISRKDIANLIDKVAHRSPSVANSLFAVLRPMYRWWLERGFIETNPMVGLRSPPPPKPRDRVLADVELVQIWNAADPQWFPFGPLTRMLILTGQRISEVAGMTQDEVQGDVWTIQGSRTKNGKEHQVDLHPLALEIIGTMPPTNHFLFTTTGKSPPSGFSKAKTRLDAEIPDMPHWRFHDLRRTCASGMAALGVLPNVIERVLNHQSGVNSGLVSVYQRYHYREERRQAIFKWGNHLQSICGNING